MTSITNQQLELFKQGSDAVMKSVYLDNKATFVGYFKSNYVDQDINEEDLYQDSFCVLHKQIYSGKIRELQSSWSTLLIGIGKNLARNEIRKKRPVLSEELPETYLEVTPLHKLLEKEKKQHVGSILGLVGETCKEVLIAFYYSRKSMVEIAEQLSYANANVAKKKKSQCLKKVRELVKSYGIDR